MPTLTTHPLAPATRDLSRVCSRLSDAAADVRIAQRSAEGRLAWGFMTDRERRAALSDARRALDEAERSVRDARRLIDLVEDAL